MIAYGAIAGAVLGLVLVVATGQAQPQPVEETRAPREAWAVDFLSQLGNTQPSDATVAMVVEWTMAEDSGEGAFLRNNPLNTTQAGFEETQVINGDGVRGYATRQAGLDAAVHTVTNGLYDGVVTALLANDPEGARQALWQSPWAASHYGWGADWPRVSLPTGDVRAQLVSYALSLDGIPYVRGGRSASGGDCSGTMQHVYLQVVGIDIGATTFSQWPQLAPVDESALQPGDLWYGQYSNDQHVGMIADVDQDGRWDLINNGGLESAMHVDYAFLDQDYFAAHTMGFRRAL